MATEGADALLLLLHAPPRARFLDTIIDGQPLPSTFTLFLVQVVLILALSKAISFLLKPLKQPAVIGEMIAGIILGPTVLGRVPGFTATLFPPTSVNLISVVSNFGLVFFMFVVGLELDLKKLRADGKLSLWISVCGILVPCVCSVLLALQFRDPAYSNTSFFNLVLFLTVALGMSALPVLARILSERRMLTSRLGGLVMTIAAIDDILGWILLAITIALINSKNSLEVLYTILVSAAYLLVMYWVVGPLIRFLVQRDAGRTHLSGDTFLLLCLVLITSSYAAEVIGLSSLIGGFQVGLLIPRNSQLSAMLSEKVEYFTVVILMPLFFTNSGLKTQFGLINDGPTAGYTVLLIAVAVLSKLCGIMLPMAVMKFPPRFGLMVGVLMSCKGLVALIVVNLAYSAAIITDRFFAILVLMVLVTTILTTPLMQLVDPTDRNKGGASSAGESSADAFDNILAGRVAAAAAGAPAGSSHPEAGGGGGAEEGDRAGPSLPLMSSGADGGGGGAARARAYSGVSEGEGDGAVEDLRRLDTAGVVSLLEPIAASPAAGYGAADVAAAYDETSFGGGTGLAPPAVPAAAITKRVSFRGASFTDPTHRGTRDVEADAAGGASPQRPMGPPALSSPSPHFSALRSRGNTAAALQEQDASGTAGSSLMEILRTMSRNVSTLLAGPATGSSGSAGLSASRGSVRLGAGASLAVPAERRPSEATAAGFGPAGTAPFISTPTPTLTSMTAGAMGISAASKGGGTSMELGSVHPAAPTSGTALPPDGGAPFTTTPVWDSGEGVASAKVELGATAFAVPTAAASKTAMLRPRSKSRAQPSPPLSIGLTIGETSPAPSLVTIANLFHATVPPASSRAPSECIEACRPARLTLVWLLESMDMPSSYMNVANAVDEIRDSTLCAALSHARLRENGIDVKTFPSSTPLADALDEAAQRHFDLLLASSQLLKTTELLSSVLSREDIEQQLRKAVRTPRPCLTAILFDYGLHFGTPRILCPVLEGSRLAEPALAFLRHTMPLDSEVTLLRIGGSTPVAPLGPAAAEHDAATAGAVLHPPGWHAHPRSASLSDGTAIAISMQSVPTSSEQQQHAFAATQLELQHRLMRAASDATIVYGGRPPLTSPAMHVHSDPGGYASAPPLPAGSGGAGMLASGGHPALGSTSTHHAADEQHATATTLAMPSLQLPRLRSTAMQMMQVLPTVPEGMHTSDSEANLGALDAAAGAAAVGGSMPAAVAEEAHDPTDDDVDSEGPSADAKQAGAGGGGSNAAGEPSELTSPAPTVDAARPASHSVASSTAGSTTTSARTPPPSARTSAATAAAGQPPSPLPALRPLGSPLPRRPSAPLREGEFSAVSSPAVSARISGSFRQAPEPLGASEVGAPAADTPLAPLPHQALLPGPFVRESVAPETDYVAAMAKTLRTSWYAYGLTVLGAQPDVAAGASDASTAAAVEAMIERLEPVLLQCSAQRMPVLLVLPPSTGFSRGGGTR